MTNPLWKPDKSTRRAISRGDRKVREALDRIVEDIERERRGVYPGNTIETELPSEDPSGE